MTTLLKKVHWYQKTLDDFQSLLEKVQNAPEVSLKRGLRGSKLKDYLKTLKHLQLTPLQKEVLVGILLGDGCLRKLDSHAFLKYDQSIVRKDLVYFVYLLFQDFVGSSPNVRIKGGAPHSTSFRTYAHHLFDVYDGQFYKEDPYGNRRKVVPHLLQKWITPISLAFWFMDDGSKNGSGGYYLHTENFYVHECKVLQSILRKKFQVETTLQKDTKTLPGGGTKVYYRLYIPMSSVMRWNELVKPFVLSCCRYKLHEESSLSKD